VLQREGAGSCPGLPQERPLSALALRLFTECPLRFRRRYVDGLSLGGVPDDPAEARALRLGEQFHLMARRYFTGLDPGTLGDPADRAELTDWLGRLQRYLPLNPGRAYYPELELRLCEPDPAPGGVPLRLVAKFDLLVVEPDGRATIYDWKTLRVMPPRERLAAAFQTVVYRYVLCAAGGAYTPGGRFDPDRVAMVYWNPLGGGREERLPYSRAQFAADDERLRRLTAAIRTAPPDGFLPTGDGRICARCEYRPLCHGPLAEWPADEGAAAEATEDDDPQEEWADGPPDPAEPGGEWPPLP